MDVYRVDTTNIRDIALDVLDANGRLRILPAAYWATTTPQERMVFGVKHGIYSFPTTELVERLREIIAGRKVIEIGAGNGVLAETLDIPGTDSRQQERPDIRKVLALAQQPPVPYGPNVVKMPADRAVRRYRPQVVIGCWVTQIYDKSRPWDESNKDSNREGIDEGDIIANCETYILVGNERVHRRKRIWKLPHTIEYPPYVYSRAMNGTRDFIAMWPGVE